MSDGGSGTAPVVVTPSDSTDHIFSAATSVYPLFAGRVVSAVALPVYTPASTSRGACVMLMGPDATRAGEFAMSNS